MDNLRGQYTSTDGRTVAIERIGAKKMTYQDNKDKLRVCPALADLINAGEYDHSAKGEDKPIITLPILFLKKCYVFLLYFFLNKVNTFSQNRLLFQRNCCRIINKLQRCLSGLRSTIGNRVTGILVRRFESSSLRQKTGYNPFFYLHMIRQELNKIAV